MGNLLNVGTRALLANQVALQTAGNNIANVNTVGYSRQTVVQQTVQGQFTGSGYIGNGVDIESIQRVYSNFLNVQATLASSTQAADQARADKLTQLEGIFSGGASGLGASISDMMNSFSDVASAPTDLTARTVALTRIDETAARIRSTSQQLTDLQLATTEELGQKIDSINTLAKKIADVNKQIALATGSGQPPNDLLDQRDQLVKDLNKYVQTSSVMADDGTMGIFIGGSQALVLGSDAAQLALVPSDYADPNVSKVALVRGGQSITMDENTLGGGEVSSLLRFQNTDLAEGRNLLGRLTTAITTEMNLQHQLGLNMDGKPGGNLFYVPNFGAANILEPAAPAIVNTGLHATSVTLSVADSSQLAASDYEFKFSSSSDGVVTRKSDGVTTHFSFAGGPPGSFTFFNPATGADDLTALDGLAMGTSDASVPAAGDRILFKPYNTVASSVSAAFTSPRSLAVASPVAGTLGTTNIGSVQQVSLKALTNPTPAPAPVLITFTGPTTFTRSDQAGSFSYSPGMTITSADWAATLQGIPGNGDTYTVSANAYPALSAGNASAMLDLRDKSLFDGAALTDGYASLIAQVGIRSQSANYAADVSSAVASNLESQRSGVSGVNLDEEAAKLLQFQQAYQASAKMIQIAQNIFDTLIQGLSR